MVAKTRMMVEKIAEGIVKVCSEFFNLFGIAAFAVFVSWGFYYGLARFGMVPNFKMDLESMYWVLFVEFITIMATVFSVRLHDGYYNKD